MHLLYHTPTLIVDAVYCILYNTGAAVHNTSDAGTSSNLLITLVGTNLYFNGNISSIATL